MTERMVISEDDFFDMLSFMVSSAHLAVDEPDLYGSFRLIDGACRLIEFALKSGQLEDDGFVREFMEYAGTKKELMSTDEPAYIEFLEEATGKLVKEMVRRTAAGK
jgi:hypothetical protein